MTAEPARGAGEAPEEREVKLRVGDDFAMPGLEDLGGASVADEGERLLVAVYWDTDALDLARAGVGVRHRNGTWTYKGRSRRDGHAVVREEREVEGCDGERLPDELRAVVAESADLALLHPVATVQTRRRTLRISRRNESIELVTDHVTVRDGERSAAMFSEVEVEYDRGSENLAGAVVARLIDGGAVVDGTAKYVRALRALGHHPPDVWQQ